MDRSLERYESARLESAPPHEERLQRDLSSPSSSDSSRLDAVLPDLLDSTPLRGAQLALILAGRPGASTRVEPERAPSERAPAAESERRDAILALEGKVRDLEQSVRDARAGVFCLVAPLMLFGVGFAVAREASPAVVNSCVFGFYLVGCAAALAYVLATGRGLAHYGFTLERTRASLWHALLVSFAVLPIALGGRLLCDRLGLMPQGTPFFRFRWEWSYILLLAPLQEFAHRGVIQTLIRDCMSPGRLRGVCAVVCASLVFSYVHLLRSPLLAEAVFLPSLLWGFAFEKDRNVLGLALSHAFLGWFALQCLSFDAMIVANRVAF
jgi:membrane protease YdiL (CAAX protease family)